MVISWWDIVVMHNIHACEVYLKRRKKMPNCEWVCMQVWDRLDVWLSCEHHARADTAMQWAWDAIQGKPIPIENSHNSQWGNRRGPGAMTPQARWFLDVPPSVAKLGIMRFLNKYGFLQKFIPWPIGMRVTTCWEITQFPTFPFSTDFDTGHGIKIMITSENVK